jgi:putative ABC transport system permease protein
MVEGSIEDLATPNGVIVDRSYFPLLGVTGNGQWALIRSRVSEGRVRVVGLTDLIRSFTTWPYVFTTLERSRGFLGGDLDHNTFYLVQISPGADVDVVRGSLAANLTDAEVITPVEFHDRSLSRWLYGTGAGMALIGGAMLGVLVGTIIVAQALYMSTKEHINEFATLRAIGSSAFYIHQVILCQALLTAVIGFCIAASLAFIITLLSANTALPIVMTPTLTLILFVLTLIMCAISAASSIIKVTRIDPAVVFTR